MFQLPNVNAQLERMKEVLKMDLSTVVQKVSLDHVRIANLTCFCVRKTVLSTDGFRFNMSSMCAGLFLFE